MGLFETLTSFFSDNRYGALGQQQTEAFVDALTYAMLSDGEIAPEEEDELADALNQFDWEGAKPVELYVDEACDRAEEVLDDPAASEDYCADIAQRLEDQKIREETYFIAAKVACADNKVVDAERVFLNRMVEAFEIDRERLALITEELRLREDF
jgi:uncharacterized membrane protein YebE (DUF533 family)